MRKKKVVVFIFINFLITWGAWGIVIAMNRGPLTMDNPTYILYGLGGLLGPVIAAFATQRLYGTREEYRQFFRQLFQIKASFVWYAAIVIIPLVLAILPVILDRIFNGVFQVNFEPAYYMIIVMLPMMILGGGLEEIGWRGVLLPELLKGTSAVTATWIIAPIWALWHVPLWFMEGTVQQGTSFMPFVLSLVGNAFLLSAIYIRTNSIFLCILLHALINANSAYFSVSLGVWSETWGAVSQFLLCFIIFVALRSKKTSNGFSNREEIHSQHV